MSVEILELVSTFVVDLVASVFLIEIDISGVKLVDSSVGRLLVAESLSSFG